MNYGYVSLNEDDVSLTLQEADREDRCSIRLYHEVTAAADLSNQTVLEVGSGRGGGASFVARYLNPASMTGVDFSRRAVEFCQQTHSVDNLRFVQGDAESLPFSDESFDAVINVESSHCYGAMQAFLKEVSRVLRPDGRFLFADFRLPDEIDPLKQEFSDAGLVIIQEEDITASVIRSMEHEDARKRGLIQRYFPGWIQRIFRQFAGVDDSSIFQSFKDGSLKYVRFAARKKTQADSA